MATIPLTKGLFAQIDDEDFACVSEFKWTASFGSRSRKYYAIRRPRIEGKSVCIRLHHFVLGIGPGTLGKDEAVDHINDDSLDCRKANLQRISQRENMLKVPGWKKKGGDGGDIFL